MSGFTFGTPAPAAAAPSSGFSFGGSSTPAAAPATGGFSFGGSSTPAPASAAPSSGFSFGGSSTPAPAAASSGFSFGGSSTPAPAPSGGAFSFGGSTAPGAAPSSSLFGGIGTQASNAISQQPTHISANMRFSALPPNAQKIISDTFMLFHQHQQTMNSVASMIPTSLATEADRAAGSISSLGDTKSEMQKRQQDLKEEMSSIQQRFNDLSRHVRTVQQEANNLYNIAHECGIYPVQTIAARRRITLPGSYKSADGSSSTTGGGTPSSALHSTGTSTPDVVQKLNTMLRDNASQVDRMEGLPSMYLWKLIEDMDTRLQKLGKSLVKLEKDIKNRENVVAINGYANEDNPVETLSLGIQNQVDMIIQVANFVGRMDQQLEGMRQAYREKVTRERLLRSSQVSGMSPIGRLNNYDMVSMIDNGKGFDPFLDADRREAQEENRIKMEVKKRNIIARSNLPAMNPASGNTTATSSSNSTPTPSSGLFTPPSTGGGLFGSKPAATGLFGGTSTSTPTAAAPSSGFSFGGSSTPAAAPATGGFSFGGSSTPAPASAAPSSGFSFGGSSTPAPAPASSGFSFGGSSTPAPAPASGFSFGSSSTPAPAPASSGFSFGGSSTPALAPVSSGFSFGGSAPAPAGTDPVTPSAPSRSSVRQRRAGRRR